MEEEEEEERSKLFQVSAWAKARNFSKSQSLYIGAELGIFSKSYENFSECDVIRSVGVGGLGNFRIRGFKFWKRRETCQKIER